MSYLSFALDHHRLPMQHPTGGTWWDISPFFGQHNCVSTMETRFAGLHKQEALRHKYLNAKCMSSNQILYGDPMYLDVNPCLLCAIARLAHGRQ